MDIEQYIVAGYVKKIVPAEDLVEKEFKEAEYDLDSAKKAIKDEDFKWATVKSYYSMFHAAKGVLFSIGLREKTHFVIELILEEISKEGKLESTFVNDFKAARSARMEADYNYEYSEKSAKELMKMAVEFLSRMKTLSKEFR